MLESNRYPRISIVTPSYNQGDFIEETIQSVLSQNYPNLEYIIIDGGSTDNSVEIIKQYESQVSYWVSECDRGQTHAINKGIARATGDILAYLNSDDYYLPGTLFKVAEYFRQFPQTDLLHGRCRYVNEQGEKIGEQFANIQSFSEIIDLWGIWWQERQFVQPEVFWSRRITEQIGHFREDLHYVMDYEYWCRILKAGGVVGRLDAELTCFRFTSTQKSNHSEAVADELLQVVQPWLWSNQTALPLNDRLRLQGQWLYQAVLMKQIERSVQKGDRKLRRWLKSMYLVAVHPQVLLVPNFRTRIDQFLHRN
ncbi:glycosyltransferase family 2 protein [Leptolyngbya sp. ST-U4]|uniref:glycosyltransferase family 2 protein n=1 Tax=Leptolyngbya sp. ST-U4 TaxID=2933912 RepID=UPI003297E356